MGYCFIDGNPVVLTHEQYEQLFAEVGKDKGWEWRISARIVGEWGCSGHDAVCNLLGTYCRANPEEFIREWVHFDFEGEVAQEMLLDVLEAYRDWYGHCGVGFKRWTRAEESAIPNGSVIQVWHTVVPKHWWWRIRPGMRDRDMVLNIQTGRVRRITGTVMNFFIEYGDTCFSFGRDIEIESFLPQRRVDAAVAEHLRRRQPSR
ncbi:MAG: hypothetical protein JST11_12280 [Acidobacteria bacterium]|nr:hypothetical protein [Acidobacteriota bacterium]